jgi:isoleucyl-tRNA synthetase
LLPASAEAEESVHLTDFPEAHDAACDEKLAKVFDRLIAVRHDVLKPIEELRIAKTIGHSLEAEITLFAEGEILELLRVYAGELAQLFVVSKVTIEEKNATESDAFRGETVDVKVVKSESRKCARCWRYLESVGKHEKHPDLCDRCAAVVEMYYS